MRTLLLVDSSERWRDEFFMCIWKEEDAGGVMVPPQKMVTVTWVQTPDEAVCISHCTSSLGIGMNPIVLPSAMGK